MSEYKISTVGSSPIRMSDIVERLRTEKDHWIVRCEEREAEIERLAEECNTRADLIGAYKTEVEQLREWNKNAREIHADQAIEILRLEAENERLTAALRATADQVEKLAFDMPAPNDYTPQFMVLANAIRAALEGKK